MGHAGGMADKGFDAFAQDKGDPLFCWVRNNP